MIHLLVDTCVGLDIPKDRQQLEILNALDELCKAGEVSLIVPGTVLNEIAENKSRIIHDCSKRLSTFLKDTKEAIRRFAPLGKRQTTLAHLNDLDHSTTFLRGAASETIQRIEELLMRFPSWNPPTPSCLGRLSGRRSHKHLFTGPRIPSRTPSSWKRMRRSWQMRLKALGSYL